jgi:saccharopine dehydrogenase-like NADP-dependent oxidoreductase
MPLAVLVVGGAGAFGSRLVDGLIRTSDFEVVIAGRDLARTKARAIALGSRARAIRLDTATVTAEALRASGAFAVVDAAGPRSPPSKSGTTRRRAWPCLLREQSQ